MLDQQQARSVMQEIALAICWQFARTSLYIPSFVGPLLAERDAKIVAAYAQDGADGARKYTGARVAQLAEEHSLTVTQLYCILKSLRPAKMAPA